MPITTVVLLPQSPHKETSSEFCQGFSFSHACQRHQKNADSAAAIVCGVCRYLYSDALAGVVSACMSLHMYAIMLYNAFMGHKWVHSMLHQLIPCNGEGYSELVIYGGKWSTVV